ncbi:hypothetical protein LTR35_009749 [Friedmanniomyces endolithicus]|uniref:RBR-type E3 ubiquitin transferase n=1 Tax=Friedmanniomyces endolithicus TaxID=329885 RepID=A0AAN6FPU0_9PEZI|nr:hypothetical protein LTR35_009749 [Friedmanniomyces endolithicus]KAK0301047.1 hypothetical protein LTS00_000195 [Friedmanniomyces endolithicus]KAK0321365.1 hypothetical protein LTR82_007818 [Friedmanniomyces endolithicus]KAK1018876.1 hypothetical protein LTR54_000688 [Friedmanniomyces endolithicus]
MAPRKPAAAPPPPRRRPRGQLNPPEEPAPTDTKSRIAKTKKAPKPKPQKYDCATCDRTLAASSFLNHLPTDECKHLINTCKQCAKAWIAAQLDSTTYDKLSCPECPEIMTNAGVKAMAAKDVYARYDEMERRGIAEKIPGWRWCMHSKCKAGQVYEPLLKAAAVPTERVANLDEADGKTDSKAKTDSKRGTTKKSAGKKVVIDLKRDEAGIFTCDTCGERACVPCDRPYHVGETCDEYRERMKRGEAKSEKFIKKKCKQCPKEGCKANIEKNGGCDHVLCTQCGTGFCWPCMAVYEARRVTHNKGCVYAAPGAIDPHAMHFGDPAAAPAPFDLGAFNFGDLVAARAAINPQGLHFAVPVAAPDAVDAHAANAPGPVVNVMQAAMQAAAQAQAQGHAMLQNFEAMMMRFGGNE